MLVLCCVTRPPASFLFGSYPNFYYTYSRVYGSLGPVILLMLWFYLTGGEVNSIIKRAAARAGVPEAKEPGEKSPLMSLLRRAPQLRNLHSAWDKVVELENMNISTIN